MWARQGRSRHCEEPTGRANARPMAGSATKQSILGSPLDGLLRFVRNNGESHNRLLIRPALFYRARNEPDPVASWFETRGVAALLTMRVMFSLLPRSGGEGSGVGGLSAGTTVSVI